MHYRYKSYILEHKYLNDCYTVIVCNTTYRHRLLMEISKDFSLLLIDKTFRCQVRKVWIRRGSTSCWYSIV